MKKATVLKPFFDLVERVARNEGDSFDCDEKRASYLVSLGLIKAEDKPKRTKKAK